MVTVTLTAKGELKGVEDRRLAVQAGRRRKSSRTCWSRRTPMRAARREAVMQEKMKAVTGGLPLPPGLGFG